MTPRLILRLEALAATVAVLTIYARMGGSWWFFVLLILAPDLSIVGYLGGTALGAAVYNLAHAYVVPLGLALYGYVSGQVLVQQLALIWLAHIAIDRALGFGLKYATGFRDHHLTRL